MGGQSAALNVPNGSTSLQLGACAAGTGASLTTQCDVLVDAHGVANLQSAGALTVQTNAGLDILSTSGTKVHTPAKVEIFAGGGKAPGACGTGAPAAPTDGGAPGQRGEGITDLTTGLFSIATGLQDGREALAGEDTFLNGMGFLSAGLGIYSAGVGGGGSAATALGVDPDNQSVKDVGTISKVGGYSGASLGGLKSIAEVVAAVKSRDVAAGLDAGLSLLGSGLGVYSAEGAGGVDIEERASGNIKMVAGNSISGSAPLGISFKTATAFSVAATVQAKFETLVFAVTAGVKAGITGWGIVSLKSLAKISSEAPLFTINAAKFEHTGASFKVQAPYVEFDSWNTIMTGNAIIQSNIRVEGTAAFHKAATFSEQVKMAKNVRIQGDQSVRGNVNVGGGIKTKTDLIANGKVKSASIKTNAFQA